MYYISGWEIFTRGLRALLAKAVADGEIETSDIVWRGPSGDTIVAADPASLEEEEYEEYIDSGQVEEYLDV